MEQRRWQPVHAMCGWMFVVAVGLPLGTVVSPLLSIWISMTAMLGMAATAAAGQWPRARRSLIAGVWASLSAATGIWLAVNA